MRIQYSVGYVIPSDDFEKVEPILYAVCHDGWEEEVFTEGFTVIHIHVFFDSIAVLEEPEWVQVLTQRIRECSPTTRVYSSIKQAVDWVEQWKSHCTPVDCGMFYVVPEWFREDAPEGKKMLYLTPKMAFGTGHHPTTALCLEAIGVVYEQHAVPIQTFCDIGTGSGILSIAMAILGAKGYGYDIDETSILNAQENAILNGVENNITFFISSIEDAQLQQADVVFANILAEPLLLYRERIVEHLNKTGVLILSGILQTQVADILAAYAAFPLHFHAMHKGEWSALIGQYQY